MIIKGITIDLFHTLVHVGDVARGRPMTYEMLGLDRESFKISWYKRMYPMCRGEGPAMFDAYREVCDENGLDHGDEKIREVMDERLSRFGDALRNPRSEIVESVRGVREMGFRVGLFSNAIREDIATWDESPLKPCFDVSVFSCNVGTMKPDAEFFRLGLERLGCNASECIHVGDGGQDELAGAKKAGYGVVIYVNEYRKNLDPDTVEEKRAQADCAIESITDLPDLLLELGVAGSRSADQTA